MPTPETTILDESAVNEIEAMDHADMCGNALYCDCGKVIRDQLCATVKHLRAENEDIKNQKWTAKRVIAWLDDPNPRPAIHAFTAGNERQIAYRVERIRDDLRSQLEQLRAENERLTKERDRAKEDLRILTKGRFIQS